MIKDREARYFTELSENEKIYYQELTLSEQAAFRICRDLALKTKENLFFMSYAELGERLEVKLQKAQIIMINFVKDGPLSEVEKGTKWTPGIKAKATSWRWDFSKLK